MKLAGPTLFAPLINNFNSTIETAMIASGRNQTSAGEYYILLILTDGAIHDMDSTKE